MTDEQKIAAVKQASERLAAVLIKAETDPWELGIDDDEILEELKAAAIIAKASVLTGDYDQFKYAVALVTATPGAIAGDRSKWGLMDVVGDLVWRVNRTMFKREVADEVDQFLADVFPS